MASRTTPAHVSLGQLKGDDCHRALPHGGAGRPCRALRGLRLHDPLPTTAAATGIARSVRGWQPSTGMRAKREAELLPVPYFHVVFTLPARIAAIAYQNTAVVYDLLVQGLIRGRVLDNRGRSQAPGRPHRHHRRAPHLGLDHDAAFAKSGRNFELNSQTIAHSRSTNGSHRCSP